MIHYTTIADEAHGQTVYVMRHDDANPDEPPVTYCTCPGPHANAKAERVARLLAADEAARACGDFPP